jgi:deoxyribodipyrimidine photo-lyase
MGEKIILVWFRNDLRIHDNEILLEAIKKADKVLPVYCFDPYYFTKNQFNNPKTGILRAQFLIDSVRVLRKNLKEKGADLIVKIGDPTVLLPQLAEEYQVCEVYHHREVAHEETQISEKAEAALWKLKLNLKHFIGHTLYHKEDLPFPIKDIPDSFVTFKKKIERESTVRPCLPTPDHIKAPVIKNAGEIPDLKDLGFDLTVDKPDSYLSVFKGGEDSALLQLESYLTESKLVNSKTARNGSKVSISSKLSPWIALGCISLRHVYWEVMNNNPEQLSPAQQQLILDLLWRDYFRFMFKKHGQQFIASTDIADLKAENINEDLAFENWKIGTTGLGYIDAIMSELNTTGFITNSNRQITASYLINTLKVDWKKGATYFEEKLIDYSPASNWGNWAFIAGINNAGASKYQIASAPTKSAENKGSVVSG